jgi:phosphonate transport system substrate-binding protein
LSFGSQSSTSGHLMPRSFLLDAKVDPDKDLKRVAFSGAHDATIAAVAAGKVDAGALNISVWEKFVADKKVDTTKVRVFYTTPPLLRLQLDRARRHACCHAREIGQGIHRLEQEHR